jgi:hypothetical protein
MWSFDRGQQTLASKEIAIARPSCRTADLAASALILHAPRGYGIPRRSCRCGVVFTGTICARTSHRKGAATPSRSGTTLLDSFGS